ncbi:hypothetical protein ATANTOWER_017282 [Ataeniobius toweri]|uniref:Secreted protein n=1 Tax=Ataeniobius toweri TaxID=208326 RepID=A0ABU7AJE0_9TELE|nr:hypothetical protein [Ataeniobius toweri]
MKLQRGAGSPGAWRGWSCWVLLPSCVWARGSGFRAVGPSSSSSSCCFSLPLLLLPPLRRAKSWGGATELFSQQTRCIQKRRLHRQEPGGGKSSDGCFPLTTEGGLQRGTEQRRMR